MSILDYENEIENLVGLRFSFEQLKFKLNKIMGIESDLVFDVQQNSIDSQCLMGVDENGLFGYVDIYYLETKEQLDNGDKVYYVTEVNVDDE